MAFTIGLFNGPRLEFATSQMRRPEEFLQRAGMLFNCDSWLFSFESSSAIEALA